jgi:hypothetical protein
MSFARFAAGETPKEEAIGFEPIADLLFKASLA